MAYTKLFNWAIDAIRQSKIIDARMDAEFGAISTASGTLRTKLTAATNFYVRTDGSDSNTGLANTAAGAFLTLQGAYNNIANNYDLAGFLATVNIGAGTYTGNLLVLGGPPFGTPPSTASGIQFVGDNTTPSNVLISVSAAATNAIAASFGGVVMIGGVKIVCSNGNGMYAAAGSKINVTGTVDFGACLFNHMFAHVDGLIVVNTGYTISGSANGHLYSAKSSTIELNAGTITLTGTPAFICFATAIDQAMISAPGLTFSGSATGSRFNADGGSIETGTAGNLTYFPGNGAGVIVRSGNYDQIDAPIIGTTTNDNALAGDVGELISGSLASGSATSLSNSVAKTIISISLTAGDWDVHGIAVLIAAGTTTTTLVAAAISLVNNTNPSLGNEGFNIQAFGTAAGQAWSLPTGTVRVSLASTTTVYLVGQMNFAVSTATAYGSMSARRVR